MLKIIPPAILVYLVSASIANAQGYDFTPILNGLDSHFNNQNFNDAIERTVDNARPDDRQSSSSFYPEVQRTQNVTMAYASVKSRTQQNLDSVVRNMREKNPVGGDQLEKLLVSGDAIGSVQGLLGDLGLQKNNVAHTYALYWVVYWGLANNQHSTPSARAMQAVAKQAEQSFAKNPEFAKMDDAQKQAAAEELMVMFVVLNAASEAVKSDPKLAAQAAKASLQGSQKSGLDLDKMTLTENGFVPAGKKRSDAGDAVGADGAALASADTDPAKEDGGLSTTSLALIAAAGGAGIAGVFLFGKAMGKKA